MGITPSQPVAVSSASEVGAEAIPDALLQTLWQEAGAESCGLSRADFDAILFAVGARQNYGQPATVTPAPDRQSTFLRSLRLADLALARACALGNERAWERFLVLYRQPLTHAAIAMTRNDSQGRELADALYAELYGLKMADGRRRCPLDSYQGRGPLLSWLRTTLAQRHVDRHRKTWREQPLPDPAMEPEPAAPVPEPAAPPEQLRQLAAALRQSLAQQPAEERFLLAAYYLDQRTLLQIAGLLHVHEATISRRLRRAVEVLRKSLLHHLQARGLSKRAAEEALDADPRDLTGVTGVPGFDLQLKKLLQFSQSGTFPEKAGL